MGASHVKDRSAAGSGWAITAEDRAPRASSKCICMLINFPCRQQPIEREEEVGRWEEGRKTRGGDSLQDPSEPTPEPSNMNESMNDENC